MNKWIRGTNSAVLSIAVIVLFILSTLFLNSKTGLQWDLTANKRNTLSEKTISTLAGLKQEVKALAFHDDRSSIPTQVRDLFQEYAKRSDKFKYEEINASQDPTTTRNYEVTSSGTIVLDMNGKRQKLTIYDMFGNQTQSGSYQFTGEEKLTQALVQLTSEKQYPVYFLSGHGELAYSELSELRSALEGDNYVVKELNLVREGKVPDDAKALFLLGPQNDLSEAEANLLKEYVKGEGKLYVAIEYAPTLAEWKHLPSLLKDLGITSQNAIVLEPQRALANMPFAIVPQYGYHESVQPLEDKNVVTILPTGIGLKSETTESGYTASSIIRTTSSAYGKSDLSKFASGRVSASDIQKQEGDLTGPFDLGYAVSTSEGKPKAVVMGSASFLHDQFIGEQANKNLALNTSAWLQENKELITITPKEETIQQAYLLPNQANWIFYGTVILYPALFLVIGGLLWWRRRRG
ncbi:GldG family protein [Paenibacillus thermoaerophilus]|uniref:GldG family protein n=1 Tax=Paenibacillus thermoaerophilus TaxID=1215385 RepID=A0ABW2V471_9BACL|nr:GldG family protein [Paenibacillus thermoaerophilus]TMV08249.1 ABC transporter [Paenibacillus thermoaerophilus]